MRRFLSSDKGFTLLEIVIVVALTVIVMGFIFLPVSKIFSFTRQAEVMVRTQDNARLALEQISRELADAMKVYVDVDYPICCPVLDANGNPVVARVYYAKIDLVLPRMRLVCTDPRHPANQPREWDKRDPNNPYRPYLDEAPPKCPYDGSILQCRPAQPLAPDTVIVRYFIGLRDNTRAYSNEYTSKTLTTTANNMYVLYRAEFSLYDNRLFPSSMPISQRRTFDNFFYYSPAYAANWKKISRPMVRLEDTDLVNISYQGNTPIVVPTVRFMPTAIYNDPMVPTMDSSDDPENGERPPTVYKASYGHWILPYEITVFRKAPNGGQIVYKAMKSSTNPPYMGIFKDSDNDGIFDDLVFNISHYLDTKNGVIPGYGGAKYGAGEIVPAKPELAFVVDDVKGTAEFAFPVVNVQLSDSASQNIQMAVSKRASTDDINAEYASAGYRDRYRRLLINDDAASEILLNGRVVPGSEKVVAPCATPGATYGKPILYSRTPLYCYEPEPNQYKLDVDYGLDRYGNPRPGVAALFFHSYQTLQSGSGIPLPPGKDNIFVFYQVQNNQKDDTLRASYVTKSLITITLGIKMFDPVSGRPENIELTNKVRVRNVAY